MKKTSTLLAAVAMIAIAQTASAQTPGPYIQGTVFGTDMTDTQLKFKGFGTDDYDSSVGLGGGAELGYRFTDNVRAGIEGAYRYNHVKDSSGSAKFQSGAAMGNAYLDIPTGTPITPYVGAGAGYSYVNLSDDLSNTSDAHDSVFAYQGMAGLSYAATPKTDFVLGYKYFATSTPEFKVAGTSIGVEAPYKVHNVELGIRYKF